MNSQTLIEEITKLTKKWYTLIGPDHHKDKDCHWYINTVWSYGCDPIYRVEHYGYIYDDVAKDCETYEAALIMLKKELEWAIQTIQYKEYRNDSQS